jgi:hypothetical protein
MTEEGHTSPIVQVTVLAAAAISIVVFLGLTARSTADSEECRDWQTRYVKLVQIAPLTQGEVLKERPDGCPVPDVQPVDWGQ